MWTLAEQHSLAPLLNSLLLEWKQYRFDSHFIIIEDEHYPVKIEIKERSSLGHHRYTGNIYLSDKKLSFNEFLQCLSEIIQIHDKEAFISRVLQSQTCIDDAITLNLNHLSNVESTFRHTETALFIGHSLHPTPKSRNEFSKEDLKRFSPEHGGSFNLDWFYVHDSIYYQEHSTYFRDFNWALKSSTLKKKEGFHLLPVHPWQKQHILKIDVIKKYIENGLIIESAQDELQWTPTSSLRTLYCDESPYMLKFSMDLKMTNSVRHLLLHELKRGLQIDDVSHHPHLTPFFNEFSEFKIIQEPLYAGILGEDKAPLTQTLIMLRENPFSANDEVCLLATLNQPSVNGEKTIFNKILSQSQIQPEAWFKLFLEKAIAPFLILQGEYGVLLGAHQQNLILKLHHGRPAGVYFRDCHGTGFESDKVRPLKKDIPFIEDSNGNILDSTIAHYLFAYYLIINSVFNTVAAISHSTGIKETEYLRVYREFLRNLKERRELDSAFIDYLLHSPVLKHKGNFFCTVKNINENTSSNPLDIYTEIPNPLRELVYE